MTNHSRKLQRCIILGRGTFKTKVLWKLHEKSWKAYLEEDELSICGQLTLMIGILTLAIGYWVDDHPRGIDKRSFC